MGDRAPADGSTVAHRALIPGSVIGIPQATASPNMEPSGLAPGPRARAATLATIFVVLVEVICSALMWAPIPLGWLWIGRRIGAATGSVTLAGGGAFLGCVANEVLMMALLTRLDVIWVAMRRSAGHDQQEGALTGIVVVSAALGIALFYLWYYVLSGNAFIIPFMPSKG